jgi:hypothetical protein
MDTEICLRYLADKCQEIYFVPRRKNCTTFSDSLLRIYFNIILSSTFRVNQEHSNKGNKTLSNVFVCF